MLFSSMLFLWVYLPSILILYFLAPRKYRNTILLVASILFYGWGGIKYLSILFFSIINNYISGILIDKWKDDFLKKKIVLIICLIMNLSILFFYKYFDTTIIYFNNIFNKDFELLNLMLPLGISFFTFQALSYVVDLYRGEIKVQKNIFDLALYITFFPQLVAGPIVKYRDVDDQIKQRDITFGKFAYGIKRFIYGLSKKVLIANTLAKVADTIFSYDLSNVSLGAIWLGIVLYSLQIYYDFGGYSDMAIGLGKMFGFDFLENFNYPYISKSIQEFWRRWHISLSTWFKEYVYIPLGGNRKGNMRTYFNNGIVFLLTGIWHGASLNFWIWGMFHGFFILLEKAILGKILAQNKFKFINNAYVLFVVMIGWAMFRCNNMSEAMNIVNNMFISHSNAIYNVEFFMSKELWATLVIGILFSGFVQSLLPKLRERFISSNLNVLELLLQFFLFTLCIANLVSGAYNPFIYFRF